MIASIEIGKTYVLAKSLMWVVTARCFHDYEGMGRCVLLEKMDGTRTVYAEQMALRNLCEIGIEIESVTVGELSP